jgi:endonuclease YncB( thermonuclease family)
MSRLNIVGRLFVVAFAGSVCLLFSQCRGNNAESSNTVSGKVVKILDGDTYDLLLDNKTTIRIRMEGIDAPEKGMPFGNRAKQFLGELCQNQIITVDTTQKETFNRFISFSYLEDGRELGQEMLKAGLAWHFTKYNSDTELAALEDLAKTNRIGLWVEQPFVLPPWTVRKLNKQGYKTQDIYRAQREHLKGQHSEVCPDVHLCEIINDDKH